MNDDPMTLRTDEAGTGTPAPASVARARILADGGPARDRSLEAARERMVERDVRSRGVRHPAVLEALRKVPRERFVRPDLAEFAYEDTALPIESGQTISQPYIVAAMAEAASLTASDRVLEVGTGSGYGAAVLSRIAGEVWTIERHADLAETADARLADVGYDNVHVIHGDGTLGFPEAAPFDAVVVTAGGPHIPEALLDQLVDGGRLVIPVGPETRGQVLLRVTRRGHDFVEEDLGAVRFVPLVGAEGWGGAEAGSIPSRTLGSGAAARRGPAGIIRAEAEAFTSLDGDDLDRALDGLVDRIGDARVVLLGEATHGSSEFYRMRARITRRLIEDRGFSAVAVEADWPDASTLDRWVRGRTRTTPAFEPFSRFPTWMWKNREVEDFLSWLRAHNEVRAPESRVGFHGLDLYSLFTSRAAVLDYLDRVDPEAARTARTRYGCLTPWEHDPARYGEAVVTGRFSGCEQAVVATLTELLAARSDYVLADGEDFLEAAQNAAVVANAERYYRIMYYGGRESWNHRDQHMFDTLLLLLQHYGEDARVVVWEHNSHIGDASATEMGARGEFNVGMLCRRHFEEDAYLVGFGTDRGTVAAASNWGGPMETKRVRPAHAESYERLCRDSEVPAFLLHLREPARESVRGELLEPRLERAIGVIYRPETELQSHYFQAVLPDQFDEYVWFGETSAVTPVSALPGASGSA